MQWPPIKASEKYEGDQALPCKITKVSDKFRKRNMIERGQPALELLDASNGYFVRYITLPLLHHEEDNVTLQRST